MEILAKFKCIMKESSEECFALLLKRGQMAPEVCWKKMWQGENHQYLTFHFSRVCLDKKTKQV